ncbi:SpoIIE family protein phosphatase [Anaerotignum lactatifermentans]|uniref:SpoIIE family protein phosphatase n=1 Tax=Anaerotignum lactatifermentans TaxID=160404 RepID=A0ABS2GAH1_9FIRM|nr:SpoIIE family protein phosphatase [Anaerotignum lactatifermentans]MBM6829546.1 SpoIIE family protein phosphatase [Anaerotignum lactatifermentans]MBM6878040.1 SpoIIE family protein phosphatase [Anaerotignum lactatifermentans]MBM6951130.1 SpoIIE family protein phosphatase [Anaerotignum lactatifermentans]
MEKTEITLETREEEQKAVYEPEKKLAAELPWKKWGACAFFWGTGFLWARGELVQILHPMGMAYLSAYFGKGPMFWLMFSAAAAGMAGNGATVKNMGVLLAAVLIHLTLGRFVKEREVWKKALLGAFAMALGGAFYAVGTGGLRFYFVVAAVESLLVLGLSAVLQKGLTAWGQMAKGPLSREESLAVFLILGGALAGTAHLGAPKAEEVLFPLLTTFFLLAAAWKEGPGAGAASGVLLGFFLLLSGSGDLALFAVLALGGMLAGSVRELGRIPAAAAFLLTAVLLRFYVEQEFFRPVWLIWMTAGAVSFVVMPRRVLEKGGGFRQEETSRDRYQQMLAMTEEKLHGFAGAFRDLSRLFSQKEREEKKDISSLVDTIAQRACKGCGMAEYCWQEEVYRTYGMTFSALSRCDSRGQVRMEDMPRWFLDLCPRKELFLGILTDTYSRYRHDLLWTERLQECRELVAQQLEAVGGILERLSGQAAPEAVFLAAETEELSLACKKAGISLKEVRVTREKKTGVCRVEFLVKGCEKQGLCREGLLPLAQRVLDRKMLQEGEHLCRREKEGFCRVVLAEEPAFRLTAATAFSSAKKEQPCGDASSCVMMENGTARMALSDGMGTGEKAAAESRTAVELLERFAEAGFSGEMAVQMINSVLLLRNGEEAYATLDILSVDLYSGKSEFIKLGAAASYICRGGRVISVYTRSLPAGILRQVSVEKNDMLLKDGDMVLMMTDGIIDAMGGEQKTAQWLQEVFLPKGFANPQDAAEFILRAAEEVCTGEKDDMTVQAGRFWKRAG